MAKQDDIDIRSAIGRWTKDRFNFRASFYTGRGVVTSDLNSTILEQIYQGLKADVGQEEATNFVNFVNSLTDMSASAFIQAFQVFWDSECQITNLFQGEGSGNRLTGKSEVELFSEGMVLIAGAFGNKGATYDDTESQSISLKFAFLTTHKNELTSPMVGPKNKFTSIYG